MPEKDTTPPGRKPKLTMPILMSFQIEAEDKERLMRLGGAQAEHIRQAIKEYLDRKES